MLCLCHRQDTDHCHSHAAALALSAGASLQHCYPPCGDSTTVASQQLPLGLQKTSSRGDLPRLTSQGGHPKHTPSAHAKEEHPSTKGGKLSPKEERFPQKAGVVSTKHLLLAPLRFQLLSNCSTFCYVYITRSPSFPLPGKSSLWLPKENLLCQCTEERRP